MIKSLINFHKEMLEDRSGVAIVPFTMLLLFYLFTLVLGFRFIDEVTGDTKTVAGIVISKEFVEEHNETRLVGKVVITEDVPDKWYIKTKLEGYNNYITCQVTPSTYTQHDKGESISHRVSVGSVTGKYYCEEEE